jgi:hypothetical protein
MKPGLGTRISSVESMTVATDYPTMPAHPDLFAGIDSMVPEAFSKHLAGDLGNAGPVVGRARRWRRVDGVAGGSCVQAGTAKLTRPSTAIVTAPGDRGVDVQRRRGRAAGSDSERREEA